MPPKLRQSPTCSRPGQIVLGHHAYKFCDPEGNFTITGIRGRHAPTLMNCEDLGLITGKRNAES